MKPIIKVDINNLITSGKLIDLELGCGQNKINGRIGIDKQNLPTVDIVADIEEGLPFFPDNSVDEIYAKSFLEHVQNFENLMREIVRILKKDGKCYIFVPHFSNPYHYSDYTHKRFFGLYSFYYFVETKNQLQRKVPNFYTDIRIKILSQTLVFKSPFKGRQRFKRILGLIFNLNSKFQEFYEENLCFIFPCYGIDICFTPVK